MLLEDATRVFAQHRPLLINVAYRILGRVADAEDVVQDAWLRWAGVEHETVIDAKAFLVRVTSRLALDRLRRIKARREEYVGPWLPEPLLTAPDVAEQVEAAESVSFAMLVLLQTLSPLERAVYVLREAFGLSHAEIGETLGRVRPPSARWRCALAHTWRLAGLGSRAISRRGGRSPSSSWRRRLVANWHR